MYDPNDTEKGVYPLELSNRWRKNFMERHKFICCKLMIQMNNKGVTPDTMTDIQEYHMDYRILQLSQRLFLAYATQSTDSPHRTMCILITRYAPDTRCFHLQLSVTIHLTVLCLFL